MHPNPPNAGHTSRCAVDDRWFDTTVALCCSGVVDTLTAPVLQRRIDAALDQDPTALIVDLTDVEFFTSAGMSVLVTTHDRVTPGIAFSVVADGPVTRRPMTLVGLDELMTLHSTLESALTELDLPRAQL